MLPGPSAADVHRASHGAKQGGVNDFTEQSAHAERDLLIACSDPSPDQRAANVRALTRCEIDWSFLVRTAIDHGVSPLVAHRLLEIAADVLPDELASALQEHVQDNVQRNHILVDALFEALNALQGRGVSALPFKGQTLGALAYDDFALRRAGDLDLLVRHDNVSTACAALEELGYRKGTVYEPHRVMTSGENAGFRSFQCEYQLVRLSDYVVVEPHWALVPTSLAIDLPYESFWGSAASVDLLGKPVTTFSLPHLLLAVCINASKHEWRRLQWVLDVAGIVERHPRLDVRAVLETGRVHGVERMVLVGLGLAQRIYGTTLPVHALKRLDEDRETASLVRMFTGRLFAGPVEETSIREFSTLRMRMRERWSDKTAYALRTLSTPTDKQYRLIALPDALRFLYVPMRLARDYIARPLWHLGKLGRRGVRTLVLARESSRRNRLLVIDWVPHVREGAGFPRLNGILRVLAGAGYRVTLLPAEPCNEKKEALYSDIPTKVDVVRGRGIDDAEEFLRERAREFSAIMVGRPMNMARLLPVLDRHPEWFRHARLIYDSEALFAMRTIAHHELTGTPLSPDQQSALIAEEVARGARANAVLAVSRGEQKLFADHGARNVTLVGYPVEPAPTPRSFDERQGLLFVGRLSEVDSPNVDSLVWYRTHVVPMLAKRGYRLALSVAGKTGAPQRAEEMDDAIRFLGVVEDLVPLYDRARVFIAPTRFAAGTPAKVYEAAAHGVPVVATDLLAGQLGWHPGEDLLASAVGDAAAFADNIVALYTQPELWARLRASALHRIENECAPRDILAAIERAIMS
jgi:glycosyltransferase involved in cell wall biosynthesis